MELMHNLRIASEMLGIQVRTMRQWIRDGKIKAVKYDGSRRWYIPESEIKRIQNGEGKADDNKD